MDTVSGTVRIAQSRHRGMPDLIVNGNRHGMGRNIRGSFDRSALCLQAGATGGLLGCGKR
jgi:hypothetical protein